MIFLEKPHSIIQNVLKQRFESSKHGLDVRCGDFDGSSYHMYVNPKDKNILTVSIKVRPECMAVLKKYGAQDVMKQTYGAILKDTPEPEYDFTLELNLPELTDDQKKQYMESIPLIKRYVMMAPFQHAFDKFEKGDKFSEPIAIPYRENETIYLVFEKDSLVVVYSLRFKDEDDVVIAKVFMQEFQDAKVPNSPSVTFTYGEKRKPLELKNVDENVDDKTGFVSMVLFKRHVEAANRTNTIDALIGFRAYFHYHLKCSKAYMHIRMRTRVASLLKALSEATPEKMSDKEKKKKTISGRTFERRA